MNKLLRRITYWLRHRRSNDELAEELEFHRARIQEELEESGLPPGAAAAASRRALGGTLRAREDARAVWIWPWLDRLWQDIRFGFRMIVKSPGFTAVAVLSLGTGIGANAAIFTVVNTVYFHPVSVEDISTLYAIGSMDDGGSMESFDGLSFLNFEDLRLRNQAFSDLAASAPIQLSWRNGAASIPLRGQAVTANYFDLFGVKPVLGRAFTASHDENAGRNPVAVLGYKTWTEQLGADPGVIGSPIVLRSQLFTVIGIAPENFRGMTTVGPPDQLWIPAGMLEVVERSRDASRRDDSWTAFGRIRPGVTPAQAESNLKNIAWELQKEYPEDNEGRAFRMERLWNYAHGTWSGSVSPLIAGMMMSSVGVVLVVVCINLAGLLLARSAYRRREFSIRVALGGSRARLIRQLLTESVMLASTGGAAAFFALYWTLWFLGPGAIEHLGPIDLTPDTRALTFTAAVTFFAGILFGLAPAIAVTRRRDAGPTLHSSGGGGATLGLGRQRLRGFLLAIQIAFSVVMLISGALFFRVAQAAETVDLGFDWKRVGEAGVNAAAAGYEPAQGRPFYRQAIERARAIPGVDAAMLACGRSAGDVFAEGEEHIPGYRPVRTTVSSVSANFFSAMRIPVIAGREFSETDRADTRPVAILARSMAERSWPKSDPIGKKFHFRGETVMREVVGVAPDFGSYTQVPMRNVYLPFEQAYDPACTVRIHAANDPSALLPPLRAAIQGIDRDVQVQYVRTIQDIVTGNFTKMRVISLPLELSGLFTLLLAVIGIYGVTAYSVAQRTQELGLRAALGAQRPHLLRIVVWDGVRFVLPGIGIGILISWVLMPRLFFSRFLMNGVRATDPMAFLGAALVVLAAALLASYIPARRATRIDPTVALRYE